MNAKPLETVEAFPYLGRTVSYNNRYWVDLYQNLRKSRRWWEMVAKLVMKMGATVWALGVIYKAVLQMVLLYGIDIWVLKGSMLKALEVLYNRISRSITGNMDWHKAGGEW